MDFNTNPQVPQAQTPQPIPPVANQNVQPPISPVPPAPKKFPLKKILFIVLGILGILVVAFIVVRIIMSRSGGSTGGEIVWWGLWEEESYVKPLIDEYQAANPKVKIKYVKQSPQDYRERLTNALAKGTGPDVFSIHNSWTPMFRNDLDVLPGSVMTASEYAQTFYSVAVSDFTTDKGIVAFPIGYDGLTLFINEETFSAAGKNPPKTWDEVKELARNDFTKKDDQGRITQAAIALGRTENVDHWPEILALMMLQNGVDLGKPEGNLAEDALAFYTSFSSEGLWDATLPSSTLFFTSGNLAMYIAPSWRVFEIQQQNPSLKFRGVPLPQVPKDNPTDPDVSYATYWGQGVWARGTKKEEAWKFLKFLTSKDSLEKLYKNESGRGFGELYPRVDMAELLKDHPLIGSIVSQAKDASSWFLQSRTFDGPTGINSQINKYFEDAINAVNARSTPTKALAPVTQGVRQVLGQYGLVK